MASNNKLRKYSFQRQHKTLQEILSIGKAFESIKIQTDKNYKKYGNDKLEEDINAVRKRTSSLGKNNSSFRKGMSKIEQQPKKCFKCGGNYPHPNFCSNCCRTKMNVLPTQNPPPSETKCLSKFS